MATYIKPIDKMSASVPFAFSHSSGWSQLSDRELAKWHAQKVSQKAGLDRFEQMLVTGTNELANRGVQINECSECGQRRMIHNHDYKCILCRFTETQNALAP